MKLTKLSLLVSAFALTFVMNGFSQNEEISLKELGAHLTISAPKGTKVAKKAAGANDFTKKYTVEGAGVSLIVEELMMSGTTTLPTLIKRNKNASGIGTYSELVKETENGFIYKSTDETPSYDFHYYVIDAKMGYAIYNNNPAGVTLTKEQAEKLFEMAQSAKIVK